MNIELARARALVEKQETGRELAMAETFALRDRHEGKSYAFEYCGQKISGRFVTACLQTTLQTPNAYRIELIVPAQTLADGECFITDTHGRRIDAHAVTTRTETENLITLETVALKPAD
jgi:hypothetical protein